MGNKSSKGKNKNKLAKKLLTELTKTTNFKKDEVKLLWDHFYINPQKSFSMHLKGGVLSPLFFSIWSCLCELNFLVWFYQHLFVLKRLGILL